MNFQVERPHRLVPRPGLRAVLLPWLVALPMACGVSSAATVGASIIPATIFTGSDCSTTGSSTKFSMSCVQDPHRMTASVIAEFGLLAGSITTNSLAQVNLSAYTDEIVTFSGPGTVTCPGLPGIRDCPVGEVKALPDGSTLTGYLFYDFQGAYTHQGNRGFVRVRPEFNVTVNTAQHAFNENLNCGGQFEPVCLGSTVTVNRVLQVPVTVVTGRPVRLYTAFGLLVHCEAGCSADFGDPALVDIVLTDPATGLTVHGLTASSDAGVIYPMNRAAAVPEPESVVLTAAGAFLILSCRRRGASG
ncbi:MAG: PEP-CTERM sorting domain-containing protein [Acidobacteria bacterium]|nr:PEP-CTERM sorting domain-containing protein [Acidobacteriota bacterium]